MINLYLIRHGETDWNNQKRLQGQSNTELNAEGLEQARLVGEALKEIEFSRIYSSKLKRAIQTSEIIAENQKQTIKIDQRLNELSLGDWDGKTYEQIMEAAPSKVTAWYEDPINISPPGGETLMVLEKRVRSFLTELSSNNKDETICIVSHGGTIRIMICVLLALGLEHQWNFRVDNTSISVFEMHENLNLLVKLNDTHHLLNS